MVFSLALSLEWWKENIQVLKTEIASICILDSVLFCRGILPVLKYAMVIFVKFVIWERIYIA